MATTIKYIGRTTNQVGKSIWEIVGNLKGFGVGRYFKKNSFERYPEPCYMRILKVEALPDEPARKVRLLVERVFRGHRFERPIEVESTTYKPDYILMPRDWAPPPLPEVKIREVKSTMELPPMLKEVLCRERGVETVPKIPLKLKQGYNNFYKPREETL